MSPLPGIILEASPHNFHITKNDMNDPQQDVRTPEPYVNNAIKAWMEAVTTPLQRSEDPEKWKRYPNYLGVRIVLKNDWFPSSLPIGYVLMCFFISVRPVEYRLDKLKRIFNLWISNQQVRSELFKAYRHGEMFNRPVEINVDEGPDGNHIASALYGGSQQDMFNSNDNGEP